MMKSIDILAYTRLSTPQNKLQSNPNATLMKHVKTRLVRWKTASGFQSFDTITDTSITHHKFRQSFDGHVARLVG